MEYTQYQIDVAVSATSPMCFIKHVLEIEYCDAVVVAMQLSYDQDGNLSASDLAYITTLMP